jgi:hypothetical protein
MTTFSELPASSPIYTKEDLLKMLMSCSNYKLCWQKLARML